MSINIGISSCLLGNKVRYDGSHKLDIIIKDILSEHFRFIPVCPEAEIGMGIPREKVNLIGSIEKPRMIGEDSGIDWTTKMKRFSAQKFEYLNEQKIRGYVSKKGSPSCGVYRVKLFNEKGNELRKARGLYAEYLIRKFPVMPIEEETGFNNPKLRDSFIKRVFAYDSLCNLFEKRYNKNRVIEFHLENKSLVMSYSQKHYVLLDQLVTDIKNYKPDEFKKYYSKIFMQAFKR